MRMGRSTGAGLSVLALGVVLLSGCTPAGKSEPAPATPTRTKAVETEAADPFAGYFADKELPEGSSAMQGSFGAEGKVAPASWIAGHLPPDEYTITVECAGAPSVDFWLAEGEVSDRRADPTGTVACPGSIMVSLTTTEEGWNIELDSKGEPGAYWVSATPPG